MTGKPPVWNIDRILVGNHGLYGKVQYELFEYACTIYVI